MIHLVDTTQRMKNAGIPEIEFGRFDKSFPDIDIIRWEAVDQKTPFQDIEYNVGAKWQISTND